MTDLENALTGVLLLGGVYGLLSLGLVMIFRATSVLNIAAGEIGLVGAYLVFAFNSVFGSFYVSLLVGVAVAALVGAVIYAVILAPVSGGRASVGASTDVAALVATIVLAQLLDAGVALIAGSSPREMSIPLPDWQWSRGGFHVNSLQVTSFVVMAVVVAAIAVAVNKLPIGLGMRAASDSPRLAALFGISTRRIAMTAWSLATVLGTLAVVIYGASSDLQPATVANLGASLFPALLLGGLDSIAGCVLGGVVLALVQSAAAVYLGGSWSTVMPYFVLLAVLVFKPTGFFGHGEFKRL